MEINELLTTLFSLGGFGALIGLVINVLKSLGVVKDGQAVKWSTGLNLLLLIGLFLGKVIGFDLAGMDGLMGEVANTGIAILELIVLIGGSKLLHNSVRGVPVIGRSFSHDG